jgi:hypothetical protein
VLGCTVSAPRRKSVISHGTLQAPPYFENEVLRKRAYLKREWCVQILENPIKTEPQEGNRHRFWGRIEEFGGKVLRVVTLDDKLTIHNAFPDTGFRE